MIQSMIKTAGLAALLVASAAMPLARPNPCHSIKSVPCIMKTWNGATFRLSKEVKLAVIAGDPSKPAPYVVRVKVPNGIKLMPHTHPEDRIYTVMSGVFYIGFGTVFDPDKLVAYGPGSVVILPANTPHFHWAKSGSTSRKSTERGRWGLNTSIAMMIRATRRSDNAASRSIPL
jgi:quercetin dioxygenase-like cupin family protein